MKIDQKFRNRLGLFVQEQKAIVFPIVFLLFCNLKIPKQGIKMQFFPEQVVETLQKSYLQTIGLGGGGGGEGGRPFSGRNSLTDHKKNLTFPYMLVVKG